LLAGFEADQLDEKVSILKRVREEKSEVAFDDDLYLNSKLEEFLMCEMSLILTVIPTMNYVE
jgi:hypothetical protein